MIWAVSAFTGFLLWLTSANSISISDWAALLRRAYAIGAITLVLQIILLLALPSNEAKDLQERGQNTNAALFGLCGTIANLVVAYFVIKFTAKRTSDKFLIAAALFSSLLIAAMLTPVIVALSTALLIILNIAGGWIVRI